MAYHIFHNAEDFWKQVKIYKSEGYTWIQETDPRYNPVVTQEDMPCVLNVDNVKTMMHSVIKYNKEWYFADKEFVKLYQKSLREFKLNRLLDETTN